MEILKKITLILSNDDNEIYTRKNPIFTYGILYKYVLLRNDGPSSRYTGDNGADDTLVCPSIKRR